jgi:hypothetical protein
MLKSRAPLKRPHRAVQRALGFGREPGYRRDDLVDIVGLGHKYIGQGGELRGALGLANPFVGFDRDDAGHRLTGQRRECLVRVGQRDSMFPWFSSDVSNLVALRTPTTYIYSSPYGFGHRAVIFQSTVPC